MHALLQLSISSHKKEHMENMSKLRELFHGIPNHFNAISTFSFALADTLEQQGHSKTNAQNTDDLNLRIRNEINAIEEAYLLSCNDIKKLSQIVDEELDLKKETLDDFTKIETSLNTIKNHLQVSQSLLKILGDKNSDSMISLTKELYLFEENCINLAELLRQMKNYLISLKLYESD